MEQKHLTEQRFAELDLPDPLLRALREVGFDRCTPVQAEALPVTLAGEDVEGQARTGTGKTATFLLATFAYLLRRPASAERRGDQPRAFILAPTRELAIQIHQDAVLLGKYTDFRLGLAYGGTGYEQQRTQLQSGVDILIGTPGRLIDYLKQGVFNLGEVQVCVLDEADRMFDLGFIRDVRFLLRRMPAPERRLNMLFSATLSHRVSELAYEHMNDPRLIKVEADRITVDAIQERVYYPANEEKIPLLLGILNQIGASRTLIFANMKSVAENVDNWLRGNGFRSGVLSGDVPQRKREHLLQAFKDGEIDVLVATDVAARGLHIPSVSHVINYDLPQDAEDYVHRIGRTARAGASGDAISFACEKYAFSLTDIEEYIGHPLPVEKVSEALLLKPKPPAASAARREARGARRREGGRQDAQRATRERGETRRREAGKARPQSGRSGERGQRRQRRDDGAGERGEPKARQAREGGADVKGGADRAAGSQAEASPKRREQTRQGGHEVPAIG